MNNFNSLVDFLKVFDTEQKCTDYLTKIIWQDGEYCPHCGSKRIYHFSNNKIHKCADCRVKFSIKVGTIFEDSKISLQKWFMAVYLMTSHKKGISSLQLSKDLGITQKTAWFMLQRLRYAMQTESFKKPLKNIVEVDETYIGGKETNKHFDKRTTNIDKVQGDKSSILGMQEIEGDLKLVKFEKTNKENIKPIIEKYISKKAKIYTDESPVYKFLKNREFVNHKQKEYVNGNITTNHIEGVFSHFKRNIKGIYHWCSKKHIQMYADMFSFRWNTKDYILQDRIELFLSSISGKKIQYKELING